MSTHLKLAVDIADIVAASRRGGQGLDFKHEASALSRRHPEAAASAEDIAMVLREESDAASQYKPLESAAAEG